jgi:hypothetical protein
MWVTGARSNVVVEALCYKPECRGFGTRCCERIFYIFLILPATHVPGVCSAGNRNKYQKQKIVFVRSRAQPVRRADNLAEICEPTAYTIWYPQHLTTLEASKASYGNNFTDFYFHVGY